MNSTCPRCSVVVDAGLRFCTHCGTSLQGVGAPPGPGPAGYSGPGGPPTGPGWPTPPPPGPPPARSSAAWLLVGVIGLVVVGLVGVGLWWWLDREPTDLLATGELFLEPTSQPGLDAFTDSVALAAATPALRPLPVATPPATSAPPAAGTDPGQGSGATTSTALASVDATRPGLYGGTRDDATCDVEQLIRFLQANPDKAAAFARVQGVTVDQLPTYLRSLTPVLLRNDTRVTNHGYADGVATPRHAILQAGTAVLVDTYGIPRVRCACGNPLLPPRPAPTTPTTSGTPWSGFSLTQTITIVNTTNITITEFVILDAAGGGYLTRPTGAPPAGPTDQPILVDTLCDLYPEICRDDPTAVGVTLPPTRPDEPILATGDVQITLRWDGAADLDLAVTSPLGDTVFHGAPTSDTGGYLDVDANPGCQDTMSAPVENIVWPADAPEGTYLVEVVLYDLCGAPAPVAFDLTASIGGNPTPLQPAGDGPLAFVPASFQLQAQAVGDTVSPDQPRLAYTLTKPPDAGSTYDPPPADDDPPPTPPPADDDPPPTPPPADDDPDTCDPATEPCPIYVCVGQETLRTGDYEEFYGQATDGIGLISACCPPAFPQGMADPAVCREDNEAGRRCTTHLRELSSRFPTLGLRSHDVCY